MGCNRNRIVLALAFSLTLISHAPASVIFSTFGPGDSFATSSGQTLFYASIGGAPLLRGVSVAFVPSADVQLGTVSFAIQAPLDFRVTIAQDQDFSPFGGTNGAGAPVETFFLPAQTRPDVMTVTSAANPVLLAGQTYWVEIQPNLDWLGSGLSGEWFNNNQGLAGTVSTYETFCRILCAPFTFPGQVLPAVRVTSFEPVAAVPEPASISLLGLGLAAMALSRRKQPLS